MAKPLLIAGHPVHPALVHFPVGLWTTSTLWDSMGAATGNILWWQIGFWSVVAGLVFSVPAAIAGLMDFAALPKGHPAGTTAVRHMLTMISAASVYLLEAGIRFGATPPSGVRPAAVLILSWLGLILVAAGGWFGGQMVYRYGVGHIATPSANESGKTRG
jgi:uncharacterized membrane protein